MFCLFGKQISEITALEPVIFAPTPVMEPALVMVPLLLFIPPVTLAPPALTVSLPVEIVTLPPTVPPMASGRYVPEPPVLTAVQLVPLQYSRTVPFRWIAPWIVAEQAVASAPTFTLPFTSRMVFGEIEPMPTLPPVKVAA